MQKTPPDPIVSVCVPAYNGAEFLEECLVSIASQDAGRMEIILLDDHSADGSIEIAQNVALRFPEHRWIVRKNPVRLGMVANWNACVALAKGEFVKLVGQDDVLHADCLRRQVSALNSHPNAAVASTSRVMINRCGKQIFRMPSPYPAGLILGSTAALQCLLSGTNLIGDPVAVLFRRANLLRAGGFNPEILYCTDMEMWLRLLAQGDLYFDQSPLVSYRVHGKATGQSLKSIVPADYLKSLEAVEGLFSWKISASQRLWIKRRSRLLAILRNAVYLILSRWPIY